MESDDGYLCDLCSEIYRYSADLIDHMNEDHHEENFVIFENSGSDNNNCFWDPSFDHDDKYNDDECEDDLPDIPFYNDNNEKDPDYVPDLEESNFRHFRAKKPRQLDKTLIDREKLSIKEIVERNSILLKPFPEIDNQANIKKRGRKPHPPRLFFCENCDYKTKNKSCMKSHLLTHTLDCPFCHFKTIRKDNYLSQHIKNEHLDSNGDLKSNWLTADRDNNVPWHQRKFFMVDIANNPKLTKTDNDPNFSYLKQIPDGRQRLVFKGSDVELAQSAHRFLSQNGALTD